MKMTLLVSLLKETDNMEVDFNTIEVTNLGGNDYEVVVDGIEWRVLDENAALELCEESVRETASYFNASFLANMTELPEEVFTALVDKNEAVVLLIEKTCGMSEFISEALSADGIGHYLNSYDGTDYELPEGYIAYRQN